jgi:hypothetical protein
MAAIGGGTALAAPDSTCSSGVIPPGTYSGLTVTGSCSIPSGPVTVRGGLTITGSGSLVADTCGLTLTISGGINVESGGSLILGAGAGSNPPCSPSTDVVVNGGLTGNQPYSFIVHGATINGGVSVEGGGGFGHGFNYVAIEDSQVNGDVSVTDLNTLWFGLSRLSVNGDVVLQNDFDPYTRDGNELQSVTINGSLTCLDNTPTVSNSPADGTPGDTGETVVTGQVIGDCVGVNA